MKQFICRLLVLAMVISMPVSAFAAEPGVNSAGTVDLKYLDPSEFTVSEDKYTFSDKDDDVELKSMTEAAQVKDGEIETLPDGPEITGWEFVGWYTAPVSYAFWGDTPETPYSDYEELPFKYDCDGKSYESQYVLNGEKDLEEQWTQKLEGYWIWLSTLEDGKESNAGQKVKIGDQLPEDVTTLYACYKPTKIEYKLYYQGWNGNEGVLSCTRQYGTPFGRLEMDNWNGYTFDGWYTEPTGGEKVENFYSVPEDGDSFYAHWSSDDGRVTHENYKAVGYEAVTKLSLRDGEVGKGLKDLGDLLELPDGQGFKNITVVVTPSDCGVTDLEWELRDDDSYVIGSDTDSSFSNKIVKVTMRSTGSKLEVRVDATGEKGTTTLTVRTKDGKVSDSVLIDTSGHSFGKAEVTQWGSCSKPKIVLYTCVVCGKTKTVESYARHNWAWRDIPGTCTTDHVWEHYCKVCGAVDPDPDERYWVRSKAPGHQFETTVTSGCGGTVTTKTCTVCGYTETTMDSEGVHNWSTVPTVDVRPTCHSDGSQSIKCLDCGAVKPGSSEIIPQDTSLHTWDSWVVSQEPTETEPGEQTRTCTSCGTEETRAIPPTGIKDDPYKIANDVEPDIDAKVENVTDQDGAAETIRNTIKNLIDSENRSMLGDDIYFASLWTQDISATIQVTPVAAPEEGDDFSALLDSGDTVVYMDIDILVKVNDQSLGKITETSDLITFKAPLPGEGDSVKVLRAHDGEVEELTSHVENGSVYFSTNKFSTFAVVVGSNKSTDDPVEKPDDPVEKPDDPVEKPDDPVEKPDDPVEKPDDPVEKPDDPVEKPDDPVEKPDDPVEKPDDPVEKPDDPVVKPDDPVEKPDDPVEKPDDPVVKPDKPGTTPSDNPGTTPGENPGSVPGESSSPAVQVHKYADVVQGAWYQEGVEYMVGRKLMVGIDDTTFAPNATTTRSMVASILYRLDGEPEAGSSPFADVPDGLWYSKAVAWAAANNIVSGYSDTQFGPDDPITREQMAAFLYRYAQYKKADLTAVNDLSGYADAGKLSTWAEDAMRWAVGNEIIVGLSDTELSPSSLSTRAMVAAILARFCQIFE